MVSIYALLLSLYFTVCQTLCLYFADGMIDMRAFSPSLSFYLSLPFFLFICLSLSFFLSVSPSHIHTSKYSKDLTDEGPQLFHFSPVARLHPLSPLHALPSENKRGNVLLALQIQYISRTTFQFWEVQKVKMSK